ncbi:hypothetical protein N7492_008997 [Penicillium capsulatum]|uniref:Zn(2)-C6 fungal-type domain-containing protein n=1 Tax=Penicillium capsulatum TaxID=69766 RepID=A0A9W9LHC0_9EURO|nr:hypothetical protein N7492_008997 [Penicillium capsulatum]KAJ6106397.1 hypothetical protein N7512_009914 [Penicillium capsulatum]
MTPEGPHQTQLDELPPRKKIRKGTRSCWECKHRKVRCHFASDGDRSCRECLARGLICRSQDLPEPENPRDSDRVSLNERMSRVESLLENVLRRLDTVGATATSVLPRTGTDKHPDSSGAITPANENAPALSLFDNTVVCISKGFLHRRSRRSDSSAPIFTLYSADGRDWKRVRQDLLTLLPTQNTLEHLAEANSSWWLLRVQCFQDHDTSLLPSSTKALSSHHPAFIGKALLWVAICLQQLPRGFDTDSLGLPCTPTRLIEGCVNAVAQSICSDEALLSSIDGLECLVVQGIFYNNDGKLRSAWLSYRRALGIAQIIGLHRLPPVTAQDSERVSQARHVWNHIIYADRYLSLMLGMYNGITDVALDSQRESPEPSSMDSLCRVAGSIIERNQRFRENTPSMVRMTQTIDSELVSINPPGVESDDVASSPLGKAIDRAQSYHRLMAQLWYYQLLAWLHLPLFLESGKQNRHDYSQQSCLEASRQMITCYTAIRCLTENSFCCKSLDFQAFTAAVTLMINIIGPIGQSDRSSNDWKAVESVIGSLEKLAEEQLPDKVATRGLGVLRMLKNVALGHPPGHSLSGGFSTTDEQRGRIKVDIPYFGTIALDCGIREDRCEPTQHEMQSTSVSGSGLALPVLSSATMTHHAGLAPSGPTESLVDDILGPSTTQAQITDPTPWSATRLELGPADIWTFDPELAALPSFITEFGDRDHWDLGL